MKEKHRQRKTKWGRKPLIAGVLLGSLFVSGVAYSASGLQLIVDGDDLTGRAAPQLIEGRTMVAIRDVAEALGAEVKWDGDGQRVLIRTKSAGQPLAADGRYRASDGGFTVGVPAAWADRLRVEEKEGIVLFYYVPKASQLETGLLFSVDRMKTEEWEQGAKESGLFTEAGVRDGLVYAIHKPGEHPYAGQAEGEDYAAVESMLRELRTSVTFQWSDERAEGRQQSRIPLTDPTQAADLYVLGLKHRNAAMQLSAFTDSLQRTMKPRFDALNGVTGGSSPWIADWEIVKRTPIGAAEEELLVKLSTATSSGPDVPVQLTLKVVKDANGWAVDRITADRELPRSGLSDSEAAPSLSAEAAVRLAADAAARYWHVNTGGTGSGAVQEFAIPGIGEHYRWMGEDLNTKAKLVAYLEEVYTAERVKQFWQERQKAGSFAEVDGRLAQPNADGGSLLVWAEAKAVLGKAEDGTVVYRFDVPAGEERKQADVAFVYEPGLGWRINERPDAIR
ncbi:hypothetical protein J31TS4_26410 [Paenibacillus sp. J31TS4]|uniref:DL-endopeptidase inhibitor IseA family protein n=1 Tax=Paenibacillus sp. J31TS4 TaxID=2807195 RepID=UPI001B0F6F04|nr:DL-endopeptidase inhibitor IseA family protein [Paenibacillus sp. J31TS4]GIP39361.1 hypothetical protein J31TS4_26410 [Paenibacillus sp. J31TS4]